MATFRAVWTVWSEDGERVVGTEWCEHHHTSREDAEHCPQMLTARGADSHTNDWAVEEEEPVPAS